MVPKTTPPEKAMIEIWPSAPTTQQVQQQQPSSQNMDAVKSRLQPGFNGFRDASFENGIAQAVSDAFSISQSRRDEDNDTRDMMMMMQMIGGGMFGSGQRSSSYGNPQTEANNMHRMLFGNYLSSLKDSGGTPEENAKRAQDMTAKHLAAIGMTPIGGDPNSIESTMSPNHGGYGQAPMQPQEDWRTNMQKQMLGALLTRMESRHNTPRTIMGMIYNPSSLSQGMTDQIANIRSALSSSRVSVSPMGVPRKDPSALFENMTTAGVVPPSLPSEPPFQRSRLGSSLRKTALDPMNLTGIGRSLVDTGIHSAKVIGGGVGEIGGILGNAALSSAKTVGGWVGSVADQVKDAYDNNRERIFGTNYSNR